MGKKKKMNECWRVTRSGEEMVMLYHGNPADCVCGTWERKITGNRASHGTMDDPSPPPIL